MKILYLWLYVILFLLQYQIVFSLYSYDTIRNPLCREEQRQLLLQLKQQLPHGEYHFGWGWGCPERPDNYHKTMLWNKSSNCCVWDGVTCDQSGRVIGLDLSCGGLTGEIHSNSSLFRLTHLRKLNLAMNSFNSSKISSNFGQLNSLTHLNLSYLHFGGQIPLEFYYLSNLVSLDLSTYYADDIYCDIKALFGNMTKIRVLLLPGVDISSEMPMNMSSFLTHLDLAYTQIHGKLPESIFEKPNLQVLKLYDNEGLRGSFPKSLNWSNVHSIKELDLSYTSISGILPESIGFMNNLNQIDLSGCKFWGPIPESIGNLTEVTEIYLSSNEFSGQLPDAFSDLQKLTHLFLFNNSFEGSIPKSIGNLTEVTRITLSSNEFSGQVPSTISNLRQLFSLDLSDNHLEGQLPDAFSDLQKLTYLRLFNNSFEGPIPTSFTNMSQLESLDISSNELRGYFPSRAGDGLQKLSDMDLSNNIIQGTMPSWLLSLPSLSSLDLSFNQLTGQIRKFNCRRLRYLDLSNNKLNIELESFYNLNDIRDLRISYNTVTEHASKIVNDTLPNLHHLELSSSEIKEFPKLLRNSTSLDWLDLSNNTIHGLIPGWFSSIHGLTVLKLSNNDLTYAGYDPWHRFEDLWYLDLRSNSLQGTFPSSTCNMSQLQILSLSDNKLRGKIPECIGNSSSQLSVLDLRRNQFNGNIPTTIGSPFSQSLAYLVLNGNQLEGPLPQSLANCSDLEILDVGNNKIQDTFPSWLQSLVELKILILRSNRFHGSIRPSFSNDSFSKLQIIDLSDNNFTGLLPEKVFSRLQAMKSQDQPPKQVFGRLQAMKSQDQPATNKTYVIRPCNYKTLCTRGGNLDLEPNEDQYIVTLSVKGADLEFTTRVLSILTTIDLSNNNFHGHIPESLAYLYSLQLLNLSHNSISGNIPPALGHLTNLEHLDLSSNQLTGRIPETLTNLTFLEVLNLSHNHLVGPIPDGHQFSTFPSDSFDGNSGLCGAPLMKKCGHDDVPPSPEEEDYDSGFMMGFTWQAVVMGYGCGVVLGFIMGNVMISTGKPKWFARFYYVEASICLNRRKRSVRLAMQGRR